MPDETMTDTFNSEWKIITQRPAFVTSGFQDRPTKPGKPTFSDNFWYRLAGNAYNFYKDNTFPSLNALKRQVIDYILAEKYTTYPGNYFNSQ
jgi:hypothetical protein